MKYLKSNKKFIIIYSLLFIISTIITLFTYNNYSLYKEPIAIITKTQEEYIDTEITPSNYKDEKYLQTITAKIKNGKYKNETITIKNEYYKGQAYEQKYKVNDEIFISFNIRNDKIINAYIEGYKRDKYIVLLTISFILLIILIGKLKGFLSLISIVINIILFYILINLNTKGLSLPILSYIGSIIFSIICLCLVSGLNKKTLVAIISTILGITLTMLISVIVINITKYEGIRFEQLELITRPYEGILISEIILGCLGAVMDISITIASSLYELFNKNKNITKEELKKSGYEIGKDITGTMINVLFFTYICGIIPNLVIYLRNGINLGSLVREYISLEMTRALTGAIGIVITIPIAIHLTINAYKRRVTK